MNLRRSIIAIAVAATLSACGGGSSNSDNTAPPPTSAPPPSPAISIVTEGVISGFGSVYVNGQRYNTSNAGISMGKNQSADESALRMGMVVKVIASDSGDDDDPDASQISYEEHLVGSISFIDNANSVLTVLGQNVYFDDLTEFDLNGAPQLTVGDVIEVSGYLNNDNDLIATFIELENDESEFKLKGLVGNLNSEQQTFTLGDLLIDYSAAEFDDMQGSDLANDLYIKVEGTDYNEANNTLIADSIENKDRSLDDQTDEVKISGPVSHYDAELGTFSVNQLSFQLTSDTEFDDGSLVQLVDGVFVKVEGRYEQGQLIALEIEFKERFVKNKTEGMVTSVDQQAGTFVLNNITFATTAETLYEDESDMDERRYTFDDIDVNDWLKVFTSEDAEGNQLVLKIKRINQNERGGEIKGAVQEATIDGFVVAGVTVRMTEVTEFEIDDGNMLTAEEFVEYVNQNRPVFVEVEGKYEDGALLADEVDIEQSSEARDDNNDDDDDNSESGKAEFEAAIESIEGNVITLRGYPLQFTNNSKFFIDDASVSADEFIAALSVGAVIEIDGVWQQDSILVFEAEFETDDD